MAAYSGRIVTMDFLLDNIDTLLQPDFLLEGYTALRGAVVISHFKGLVAELPGYVVYRPSTKQLIVGISGTSSIKLAVHDLRTLKVRHPSGRGEVHAGFWSLYQGIKPTVLDAIAKGLKEHNVQEIAFTGHSMGGSVSYLLAMDLLAAGSAKNAPLPPSLKIAVFGAPRTGSPALVKYWWELVDAFQNVHGQDSLTEYSVKAYNDGLFVCHVSGSKLIMHSGVHTLPPYRLGFRHFAREPMYLDKGQLYHIPREASEDALFTVSPPTQSKERLFDHPLGGHNYYNGRDHEKFFHRTDWMLQAKFREDGWEDRYRQVFTKNQKQSNVALLTRLTSA